MRTILDSLRRFVLRRHVCVWCKHEYGADKQPVRLLSPDAFARVKSHGVCEPCREAVAEEARKYKPKGGRSV